MEKNTYLQYVMSYSAVEKLCGLGDTLAGINWHQHVESPTPERSDPYPGRRHRTGFRGPRRASCWTALQLPRCAAAESTWCGAFCAITRQVDQLRAHYPSQKAYDEALNKGTDVARRLGLSVETMQAGVCRMAPSSPQPRSLSFSTGAISPSSGAV